MRRSSVLAAACMLAVVVGVAAQQQPAPQAPADAVKRASDALGVSALKVARFSGFGANFTVGQSPSASDPWPRVTVREYDAVIDFDADAMRVEMTREQGPVPPRGGGVPFTGTQTQIQFVRGNVAWNVQPPPAGRGGGAGRRGGGPGPAADPNRLTADQANLLIGVRPPGPPPPVPQPNAVIDRRVQIYLTPHGFLRAAAANNATARAVDGGTEIAFSVDKIKLTGLVNSRNEVAKITALIANPVLGDMPVEATFSNYQTFDEGVLFPLRIVQQTGGHPSLDLWVSRVEINPQPTSFQDPRNAPRDDTSVNFTVPEAVANATAPAVTVTNEELGPGIQYLKGGSHHSVAIEMRDHVVLVEAPQDEARAAAVIAKTKELFPNKPIRYVVNTHHHFDHSGGLRTAVAEGATVVTHRSNQAFYREAWSAPRTIDPDRLSETRRRPTFVPVAERHVLTDGSRSIQIHRIAGNPHNDGFLMVYLPAEKILIEADAYTPAAAPAAGQGGRQGGGAPAADGGGRQGGGAPAAGGGGRQGGAAAAPPPVNPSTKNLLENIERLKLDVAQIAALHGPRLATMDDLRAAVNPPAPAAAPAAPAGGRGGA